MTEIATEACPVQPEGLEVSEVPDGYIVYRGDTEKVHFLNPTAAFVFELCDGLHTLGEIEEIFRATFEADVDEDVVRGCLRSLMEQGLVRC